ncbi:MAG TPA: hypothetical protein VGF99_10325, partial [Myxococcota bacterium]
DSYTRERHPPTARALKTTMAQTALNRGDDRSAAARDALGALFKIPAARRQMAGELSGLDIAYDLGGTHPLVGRRVPDRDLVVDGEPRRLFSYLHDGRGLLVSLSSTAPPIDGWRDRVDVVVGSSAGAWTLPVIGDVEAPTALLVRPDGHVAWVGDVSGDGDLETALTTWFGPAR